MTSGPRTCKHCGERKPLTEFSPDKALVDGRKYICRACATKRRKASDAKWKAAHPGQYRASWRRANLKRHGLTVEDYESMQAVVPGCGICGSAKVGCSKRYGNFHVDHDHRTGRIRGLLCQGCNVGLGAFRDNPETLAKAIEYLRLPGGSVMTS